MSGIPHFRHLANVLRRQLPYVAPMLAWTAVVAARSRDLGTEERTTDLLVSAGRWLSPGAQIAEIAAAVEPWSWPIRKLSHVSEYAMLAILACRWLLLALAARRRT